MSPAPGFPVPPGAQTGRVGVLTTIATITITKRTIIRIIVATTTTTTIIIIIIIALLLLLPWYYY